ncbi:MAG: anthranilate synthase component 1 [Flavobacteriaceae bacterium]|jgi:anthranilate synthase component 1
MYLHTKSTPFNADIYTPVELYLSLRNNYRKTCLLEANDYHSRQDSKSIIGCEPIVELQLNGDELTISSPEADQIITLNNDSPIAEQIQSILEGYNFQEEAFNGFFGRLSFEFNVRDETHITKVHSDQGIPTLHLFIFKYIIVIDHFTNQGKVIENSIEQSFEAKTIHDLFQRNSLMELPFEVCGDEEAEYSDKEFAAMVEKGIEHCKRGDVFQLVLSNSFQQKFFGDDFQVYRQLRQLNPSPYLFYFDFESYRLFGSSPEAQLIIKAGKAEIHPIAGTIPKTGVDEEDLIQLEFLKNDAKENAEHTMLVDLARNDLSRDCSTVKIEKYKEVQHFSHVTHLVSKVTGQLDKTNAFEALSHSFPAGTLSGTPKPKALEIIHRYESTSRDFYGGALGLISANGDVNTAIVIRSFLSQNNVLHYRAGAGIVLDSIPERETQEVHHKLRALRTALKVTHEQFSIKEKQVT